MPYRSIKLRFQNFDFRGGGLDPFAQSLQIAALAAEGQVSHHPGFLQQLHAAGVRGDLPEGQRGLMFAGHSLRAGLASSAEVDERYVQKQLGHASAEMTRKYQRRRDRFRVNLTKAAGL